MPTLHIALHDGFADDRVVVELNGREVFNKAVKTDLRISRADAIDAQAPDVPATVRVNVRGRSTETTVDPALTPYLAIDLAPDGLPAIRASAQPFAYL